jgi:hypothetical protein
MLLRVSSGVILCSFVSMARNQWEITSVLGCEAGLKRSV